MKVLIATITCHRDNMNGRLDGIRDTWLREWGHLVDSMFVYGVGHSPTGIGDLLCPHSDSYAAVVWKVQEAIMYALSYNYDYLFVSDTDTYIHVPRLLAAIPDPDDHCVGWCHEGNPAGGNGYWLDRVAMHVLAEAKPRGGHQDIWAGEMLRRLGITVTHDKRYTGGYPVQWVEDGITAHLGRGTDLYDPRWMRDFHKEHSGE